SLGSALPKPKYFIEALFLASRIFNRKDKVPEIDGKDTKGLVIDKVRGEIEFQHPSCPDSVVFKDFNLKAEAGKTWLLLGLVKVANQPQLPLCNGFMMPTMRL
ncbi:hypothetical protein CUMW_133170, partial [Citrus unshiu]